MRASYRAICAVLTAFMVSRSVADSMVNFTMTVDGQNTCGIDVSFFFLSFFLLLLSFLFFFIISPHTLDDQP